MASGHVNRANRPNTWLLRPMLQREDSSCQPGAVHTWPIADMTARPADRRFRTGMEIAALHRDVSDEAIHPSSCADAFDQTQASGASPRNTSAIRSSRTIETLPFPASIWAM